MVNIYIHLETNASYSYFFIVGKLRIRAIDVKVTISDKILDSAQNNVGVLEVWC